jgi:hypothetical protein
MGVTLPTSQYDLRELAVNLATACVPTDKPWIPGFLERMGGEFASLFFRYVAHKPWAVEGGGAGSEWQTALLKHLRS